MSNQPSNEEQAKQEAEEAQQGEEQGGNEQAEGKKTVKEEEDAKDLPPPTPLEWGVRLVSVALLLLLMGYVAWNALQDESPISFLYRPHPSELRQAPEGDWVLPVDIVNRGSRSVLDCQITAQLVAADGSVIAENDLTLPLLGAGQKVPVEFWFPTDPRPLDLRFNVQSYKVP